MVIEFIDAEGASAHDEFQAWRTGHQDGVFLTLKTRTLARLHGVRCQHLGSGPPYYLLSDRSSSLTTGRKVCGTEEDLLLWARKNDVTVVRCKDCVRDELIGAAMDRDDLNATQELVEGAVETILATRYERNREARRDCLAHYGASCRACGLEMGGMYGPRGEGYIHVHHKVPLSTIGREYRLDPLRDLVPVCPNCHAMLHQTEVPLEVQALAEIIRDRR